jgi:hypothetical protein
MDKMEIWPFFCQLCFFEYINHYVTIEENLHLLNQ